jgi:hypothetical protein
VAWEQGQGLAETAHCSLKQITKEITEKRRAPIVRPDWRQGWLHCRENEFYLIGLIQLPDQITKVSQKAAKT